MLEEKLLKMQLEKQEIEEFVELFKGVPKNNRRDIKYIMIGARLVVDNDEVEKYI